MKDIKHEDTAKDAREKFTKATKEDVQGIFITKSGYKLLPYQVERINPAWALRKDELWILHPLTHLRKVTLKKWNEEITIEREELEDFVITSGGDAFLCSEENLRGARVMAHIPDTVLEAKWSIDSIRSLMEGKATVNPNKVFESIKE